MKHYITIFAAISAIASFGAVNIQTAKLSTLPGKTMVVTNITGAASVSDVPTDSTVADWGYIKSWTETDPTIPSWAKATSKPTYGWKEITNTPAALPNPNALSFYSKSGILIFSYDGREAKSVIMEDMGDMGDMGGAEFLAWRGSKNPYLGENSHSTGEDYSVALGVGTEASGTHSVALGAGGVRATAKHALAVGNSVEARAIDSTAIGYSSFANAQSSTAIGGNAYANGERSHAAGWAAIADALNSTAVGNAARVHAGAVGATAIGSGATVGPNATNAVQIGFGVNNDPETLQFMGRKVLLDDLDYAKYEVVTNDYGEEWVYFCGLPGWTVTPPTWNSSESRWQSYFTDPIEGSPWLTDWGDPDAKGYDATLLTIDGYKSVAYRGIHMVTNLVHSRISTTNDLSHANPVFSNEVLAVSLELFDTNTVAVLNDLAGTVDGIPLEGGAASIGTILLALLAAVAWLKKNKIGANDVKRVYNAGGTQYIDGDGGVYKADVELGGHWTLKQLNYTYIAKYKGRREVAGNPYYWVTDDGNRYIYYTPETGKISINGNKATPGAPANLNPEHGDDFPGTFSYSNWTAVFTKQQSVFPSEPQDKIAKKSELDGKANVSDFSPTNPAPYVSGVIDARLPYPLYAVPSTGLLKDRAINTTSLASVTVPDNFTDLLIRASVASSLAVTMPDAITTKYGDTFPAAAGEYLITITKTGVAETYVRVIKLEVAQ